MEKKKKKKEWKKFNHEFSENFCITAFTFSKMLGIISMFLKKEKNLICFLNKILWRKKSLQIITNNEKFFRNQTYNVYINSQEIYSKRLFLTKFFKNVLNYVIIMHECFTNQIFNVSEIVENYFEKFITNFTTVYEILVICNLEEFLEIFWWRDELLK